MASWAISYRGQVTKRKPKPSLWSVNLHIYLYAALSVPRRTLVNHRIALYGNTDTHDRARRENNSWSVTRDYLRTHPPRSFGKA